MERPSVFPVCDKLGKALGLAWYVLQEDHPTCHALEVIGGV